MYIYILRKSQFRNFDPNGNLNINCENADNNDGSNGSEMTVTTTEWHK